VRDPNNTNNDTNSFYSLPNSINLTNSSLSSGIQNLTATSGDNQITLNWENVESGSIYYVDWVKPDGSVVNVATVTQLTTTITALENGTSYKYNVYASKDDMLQISATPIGKPIIISVVATNNYTFTTNINLNGDSKVYIMIIAVTSTGNLEVLGNKYFTAQSNTIVGSPTVTYTKWVTVAVNNAGSITFPLAGTSTLQENIG
jgi:hypothetical protein